MLLAGGSPTIDALFAKLSWRDMRPVNSAQPLKLSGVLPFVVAAGVALLLLSSLVVDLVPRFHLGDSAVFLSTRYGTLIPDNRSWTYGLAIGWVLRSTGQLVSVPLCQIALSWTAFAAFAASLAAATGLNGWRASVLFLIGCFEPLGYYWSRSFMADSPAQSLFVLLCALLLWRANLAWRFLLVFFLGFALIGLRIVYFPAIAAALFVTLACHAGFRLAGGSGRNLADRASDLGTRAWAAALAAFLLANLSYAFANTAMTHGKVLSTDIGDMEFLVGALSPLMGDELDKTPLTTGERAELPPLTYANRVSQTFGAHGLVPAIREHFRSREDARPAMKRLVFDTIRRHPLGLAQLVLRQWSDYLNPSLVVRTQSSGALSGSVAAFAGDSRVILPDYILEAFAAWKIRPLPTATTPQVPSPALRYLEKAGGAWSLILAYYATFGIFFLPFVYRGRTSDFPIFAVCFSFVYMATIAFGANQLVTRYLLPLDVPLLCSIASLLRVRTKQPSPVAHGMSSQVSAANHCTAAP